MVASEPGREFAFTVAGPGGTTVNSWRYQLEPRAGGTDVTESFELADTLPIRLYWMLAGPVRGRTNRNGMRATWSGSRRSPNRPVRTARPPSRTMSSPADPALVAAFAPSGTLRASINLGNPVLAGTDPVTGNRAACRLTWPGSSRGSWACRSN